jgi:hypothetical protein
MRSVTSRAIGALSALLLFSGPALLAQDKVPLEKARTASGTISFIQKETRQFVVKTDDGTQYIFTLDERTSIRDKDKDVRLLDMGEGMPVTVTYVPKSGTLYAVSIESTGKKAETPVAQDKPKQDKEASPIDAEPITVKGKIEKVASDLSEVTVRTFDDKVHTFQVDEDTRQRYKNKVGAVPNLDKGAEVTAVYMIQNGRNRLVTLSDLNQPEPATGPTRVPFTNQPSSAVTHTTRMSPDGQTANVNVTGGIATGLPLVGGVALPAGFLATSEKIAGALNGTIAQVQRDMLIMTSGSNIPPGVPTIQPANNGATNPGTSNPANPTNPGNTQRNVTGQPSGFVPSRGGDFFVVMAVNSREPYILDGTTRILNNNQPIRWQALREGMTIQAHFNVSGDGSKIVHTIIVMQTAGPASTTPTNPNNQPAATDAQGNPTQPNQVSGRTEGRGVPPASQFPPLPNQTGTGGTANPASTTTPATNAGNIVSGRIARLKFDSLYLQRGANDISFMTTRNSFEPLRMDNGSRVTVNGQEARFTDLQPGMTAQVFVEFVNNVRRVVGIAAGNQNTIQPASGTRTGDR